MSFAPLECLQHTQRSSRRSEKQTAAQWEATDCPPTDLATEVDVAGKGLGTLGRLSAATLAALERWGEGSGCRRAGWCPSCHSRARVVAG